MAEHSFEIKIIVTTDDIVNLLACEGGGFDYWAEICWNEKDYEAARNRILHRGKKDRMICYEEIVAEILEAGGKLTVYDREEDKDHELTLDKLLTGFRLYAESMRGLNMDDFDADVADQILQNAVFGDVVYS